MKKPALDYKVALTLFPPPGTTKIVYLSLNERKQIFKERLIDYIIDQFKVGSWARIKYYGGTVFMTRLTEDTYFVKPAYFTYGPYSAGSRPQPRKEFADFLKCYTHTDLLKIIKMVVKNDLDRHADKMRLDRVSFLQWQAASAEKVSDL